MILYMEQLRPQHCFPALDGSRLRVAFCCVHAPCGQAEAARGSTEPAWLLPTTLHMAAE